jgi:hypothetical protein
MMKLSTRTVVRPALAALVVGVALLALGLALAMLNGGVEYSILVGLLVFNSFALVGLVVAVRRPENLIGWLFCSMGVTINLGRVLAEYGRLALVTHPGTLPGGFWAYWLGQNVVGPLAWLAVFIALFLFPSGRPLSGRWGRIGWAAIGMCAVGLPLQPLTEPQLGDLPLANPFYAARLADYLLFYLTVAFAALGVCLAVTAVLRFRRADPIGRLQLKWFTYALVLMVGLGLAQTIAQSIVTIPLAISFIFNQVQFALLAVTIGIAILRYRLYDIDLIIRRTLIYGVLTALLAGIYFGGVVLLQALLRPLTGAGNDLAVVATTLGIAALFLPLRQRVQGFIDRRFYRRKYDAAQTLAAFNAHVRDEVELDRLTRRLLEVVDETMRPAHVALWLAESPNRRQGEVS